MIALCCFWCPQMRPAVSYSCFPSFKYLHAAPDESVADAVHKLKKKHTDKEGEGADEEESWKLEVRSDVTRRNGSRSPHFMCTFNQLFLQKEWRRSEESMRVCKCQRGIDPSKWGKSEKVKYQERGKTYWRNFTCSLSNTRQQLFRMAKLGDCVVQSRHTRRAQPFSMSKWLTISAIKVSRWIAN